ncbi:uncharacterized protein LOC103178760 isoform X2 [Callorhinchus milii]|uniref:uncharacterized protein LOC103178760 isoform X2 n=1 Tax=Callorhinchus milii TaxID=7868 RepID=UPI00045754D0|nr:uncharacterized protein LOC103178760 isoform X2 [Callorhinchus milii]|eukprot:gi/632952474/ref/XP_007891871.1/ PREDICTED: uncharacterized protein LOC103178760 isoform X2 [Callorhinchus milii]
MDEVWVVSLCFTLLAIMVAILSLRKPDPECQSIGKVSERSQEPSSPSRAEPQTAARYLELTLEDIEKSLERLGAVLSSETPTSDSPASCSASEEQPQRDRRGEANPRSHPRAQGKVFERPPVPNAENFTEHIELEIQETVDHNRDRPEVIRARRVTPPTSWIENKTNDDALQSEKLHSSD